MNQNTDGIPEYSEISTGTLGSFHTTKDLGAPDDAVGHYELDSFSYKYADDPRESVIQYEEPGVVFVTNRTGRVIRTSVSYIKDVYIYIYYTITFNVLIGFNKELMNKLSEIYNQVLYHCQHKIFGIDGFYIPSSLLSFIR